MLPKWLKRKECLRHTPLENKLIQIAEPVIADLGFNLVMLEFKGSVLQVFAERGDSGNLSLDDCTAISKMLSPLLEVEDPIPGAYTLEISSPGIDRPLIKSQDFATYRGFEVRVELEDGDDKGQKRFRGRILGEQDGLIGLLVDNDERTIEWTNIKKARLVLTDELIKATAAKKKEDNHRLDAQGADDDDGIKN